MHTHIHMCFCIPVNSHTCKHIHMLSYMCLPMHIYTHRSYIQMHVFTCTYTHVHICMHTNRCTYTHTHAHTCIYAHSHTERQMHIHRHTCPHTHTHTQTHIPFHCWDSTIQAVTGNSVTHTVADFVGFNTILKSLKGYCR